MYKLNNAPPLESRIEQGSQIIDWQKNGVKSIETDYFNALPPDHPSVVFVLWRPDVTLDYRAWFAYDATDLPQNYEIFTSIDNIFIDEGVIKPGDLPLMQLQSLIRYMENECLWTDDENIYINKTLNYLAEQKVNELLFFRYVMKFMKEKEIRCEKGFTKSLLKGQFEHGFVSLEQLTHRFLVIYDEDDRPHFLFAPRNEGQFYYLDEIPYYLEGNQSISLYGERDMLKEQSMILLPESSNRSNMHTAQLKIELNKDEALSNFSRKDRLTGHYSFLTRDDLGSTWFEELGIAPDSISLEPTFVDNLRTDPIYPYQVEFNQAERSHEFFQTIDDSIGWLDLSSAFPLGVYQEDELDADFGDYLVLPFVKKHAISIFIQNDEGVSIAEDVHSIEISNDVGSIEIKLFQLNERVVKVQLNIELVKRYLKGDDIESFQTLLQKYSEIRQKKWLLKM